MQTRRKAAESQATAGTPIKANNKDMETKSKKADDLVDSILKSIPKNAESDKGITPENVEETKNDNGKQQQKNVKKSAAINGIRGKPKSGRPWKDVKQKFSTIKKSIYRRPFEKKQELRNELRRIKELSNEIKEQKKVENEDKKLRRAENARRRLENERKSEVVQIIKNPAKLKRMKKKALRKIEKRDLSVGKAPKVV